jgi:hypothetical protein
MKQYTFTPKTLDRLIPLRFKVNYWLLRKLGLFGFALVLPLLGSNQGPSD